VETTHQLEEKLKEKLGDTTQTLSMEGEKHIFLGLIETCISLLVQDLYSACEPALTSMGKINWQNVEAVGDQSAYVSSISSQLRVSVPVLRDFLSTSRKYFVLLCQQFAKIFMSKYIASLYKCKNVNKMGAQQLLLDTQSLKSALLDLPSIGLTVKRKPPDKYSKLIVKEMGRTEMIMKIIMTPVEQVAAFVDHTCKLLPDCDLQEFVKLLDMKGYKRTDHVPFLEEFRTRAPLTLHAEVDTESTEGRTEFSRIKKLEKLIKKRL
jgi:hypothetical protein